MPARFTCVAGALALGLLATPLAAADTEPRAAAQLIRQLITCRALSEQQQRLACFDQATARLAEVTSKRDLVLVERDQVAPRNVGTPRPTRVPPSPTYDGVIASVAATGYQTYLMRMVDGHAWRISEVGDPPAAREPVHIVRGVLGSSMAQIGGRRGVRALQVR